MSLSAVSFLTSLPSLWYLQQMAEQAGDWMSSHGVTFIRRHVPTKLELVGEGPPRVIRVTYKGTETGEVHTADFNTVRENCSSTLYVRLS